MKRTIGQIFWSPINFLFPGKNAIRDVSYGPEPLMTYDEYPVKDKRAPIIIFWYGGSWKNGIKSMYRFVGHRFQAMGAHTFVVDYPKYPRRVFPGFTDDALLAIRQIKKNNPGRQIILMGHSAGANTAMLASLNNSEKVDKVVSVAGPNTLLEKYWSSVFGDALKKGLHDPRTYVTESLNKPKYLLIHGLRDRIVAPNDSITLHNLLQKNGYVSRLILLKFAGHIQILPLLFLGPLFRTRGALKRFIFED